MATRGVLPIDNRSIHRFGTFWLVAGGIIAVVATPVAVVGYVDAGRAVGQAPLVAALGLWLVGLGLLLQGVAER